MFYVHPYFGEWSILTNIFQMGWSHQLACIRQFILPNLDLFLFGDLFTDGTMVYHLQTTIWKNIFGTFSNHATVANPSFCTVTGLGGSFQGIANLIRITDPCTELGLTGGKLENSSSLDGGTGTNDLLTWYESLKTLNEGLFKYPYRRIK